MKKLNLNALVIISMISILIDNIAFMFINDLTSYIILRSIGRLYLPIFLFIVVELFHKAKDPKKLLIIMLIVGVISQLAYSYLSSGKFSMITPLNPVLTLFISLITLVSYKYIKDIYIRWGIIILIYSLAFLNDNLLFIIPSMLSLYIARKKNVKYLLFGLFILAYSIFILLITEYTLFNYIRFASLLSIPILLLYSDSLQNKLNLTQAFIIFYPVHMLIIRLIATFK